MEFSRQAFRGPTRNIALSRGFIRKPRPQYSPTFSETTLLLNKIQRSKMKFEAVCRTKVVWWQQCAFANFLGRTFEASCVFFPSSKKCMSGWCLSRGEEGDGVTHLAFRQRYIKHFYLSFLYLPVFFVLSAQVSRDAVTCSRRSLRVKYYSLNVF